MLKILQTTTTTYIGFRDDDSYARRLKIAIRILESKLRVRTETENGDKDEQTDVNFEIIFHLY